jgi:protein tyrosine phosphatase (PTP) superfamily phosphohydrolase (DUF442 family)
VKFRADVKIHLHGKVISEYIDGEAEKRPTCQTIAEALMSTWTAADHIVIGDSVVNSDHVQAFEVVAVYESGRLTK